MSRAPKNVAFNPLTWASNEKGFDFEHMPPIELILSEIKEAGFHAVHAEVPGSRTEEEYISALRSSGLNPAPGYFSAEFSDASQQQAILEKAKKVASFHQKLGLDRIFIAEQFGVPAERLEKPGIGVGSDLGRLTTISENLNKIADAMAEEGVLPCLHPHVGTLIETESEINHVLNLAGKNLLFGPDTGHLAWAGINPVALIAKFQSKVGAVHIKDMHGAVAETGRTNHSGYIETMVSHLWTEPGKGNIDFEGVFNALGDFKGWFVIEVDYADVPTPLESARISATWAEKHADQFAIHQ